MDKKFERIQALINDEHDFPCEYTFKFIIPMTSLTPLMSFLGNRFKTSNKPSSGGKYISITAVATFDKAEDIIQVYETVDSVPGVIAL